MKPGSLALNSPSPQLWRTSASKFALSVAAYAFELLSHCQKLPESHRPARIIAISGEYEAGALRGHAVQFMPKPFNVDTLLDMLGGKPN